AHQVRLVRKAQLLERDGGLHAVGRGQRIELDAIRMLRRPFFRDRKRVERRAHPFSAPWTSSRIFFPSPKGMRLLSLEKGGLSTPGEPEAMLRFMTMELCAFHTSSTGIPAMGLAGSSCALGFTMSFAPIPIAMSVSGKSSLISSISRTMS